MNNIKGIILNVAVIILLYFNNICYASSDKNLGFISLKVSEANIRVGPGVTFPVKWILVERNIPLEIIDQYDNWYKVVDETSQEGWVHKSLVSRSRYFVIIKNNANLYQSPNKNIILYKLESGVRGKILSCRDRWCNIRINKYMGWILKSNIWGVYTDENI